MKRGSHVIGLIGLIGPCCCCGFGMASAGDWPMWRYDAHRSAASPEELPNELHLQWTCRLPKVRPAWPNEARLGFDASYEPVVLGKQLFVGSPNDGSVRAFDTETGRENWTFSSDGPVRLAPLCRRNKVYFGSDDGHLYCLDASDGSLLWKVSGAPGDRGEYRHLGNGRLVSFWPVRGGPVSADGVVYFAAGIWPSMGVFVHAVDAESGKLLWTNSKGHFIENVRIDHNLLHEAAISPQGHMLVAGDMLIVPNGRSMPARLDRRTGKLSYFVQGYRNGDSRVAVAGDLAFVGENGVLNLKDGREIGNRWVAAGKDAPQGWSGPKKDQFEGPFHPYKLFPACNHRSVFHEGVAYGMHRGTVYAHDLRRSAVSLYERKEQDQVLEPARWDAPLLWKLATEHSGRKLLSRTLIKAGQRLYGHVAEQLLAIDLPAGDKAKPTVAWSKQLDDVPATALAADGKLFVVTNDGAIRCYAAERVEPGDYPLEAQPLPHKRDGWTETAKEILKVAGTKAGYALVLGLSNGRLVEELLAQSEMRVVVIDDDAQTVDALRRRVAADGRYGSRFQALVGRPFDFSLPPCLASLVVSEEAESVDFASQEVVGRLFRVLRPYGGTACFDLSAKKQAAFAKTIEQAALPNAEVRRAGRFACLSRAGALPGAADWTHETADAARSFYSKDERVKSPLGVLWYGDGPDHGFYKRKDYGHGVKPQVAGGRLFALQIATNTLHAVDVYTGRLLWVRKVGESARYASMPDAVYVAVGSKCDVLDPETGEPRTTFALHTGKPADHPISVSDIRVDGNVILISVRFNRENAISKGRWDSKLLIALDRKSGQPLWTHEADRRYNTAAIAMADGRVYAIDSHSPIDVFEMRRKGNPVGPLPSVIMALDARTGDSIWKTATNDRPGKLSMLHFLGMRTRDDWLAYSAGQGILLAGKSDKTYAFDAKTGKRVWQKDVCGNQPLIVGETTFINQAGFTFDTRTGKIIDDRRLFTRGGCNYAVGNKNLLFVRDQCAAYVDVESHEQFNLRNLRSGCSNSLVAADGLLNAPCFSVGCVCNYPIQTSFSMIHMPEVARWSGVAPLKLDPHAETARGK